MRNLIISVLCVLFSTQLCFTQQEEIGGFYFGPKLGPTIGLQDWDGFERRAMLNYHGALFIESLDPDFSGSLYAQLGYHSRGSGLNIINFGGLSNRQSFKFYNISLGFGAKKRLITNTLYTPYYFVGVRVEYQMNNNLEAIQERYNSPFYPVPEFVNDWTYGISFGGGIEFLGTEFVQPALEFSIHPDVSYQYRSVPIPNVINPFNGQTTSLPERKIRNITLEISLSIRFLRKVVFVN